METFNRDIHPLPSYVQRYPTLEPLLCNPLVTKAFDVRERLALRSKRVYNALGLLSLVCIALVMVAIAYGLSLAHLYGMVPALEPASALIGGVGLLAQVLLIIGKFKDRWLFARFAAERLRSIKFQAFSIIANLDSTEGLAAKVDAYSRDAIAALEQDLLGGRAAIALFDPETAQVMAASRKSVGAPALLQDVEAVYDQLRFSVQEQHFENAARREQLKDKVPAVLAELSFLSGGLLACAAIVLAGVWPLNEEHQAIIQAWLHFGTLLMFTFSAILAVYQRGAARQIHAERYGRYAHEIRVLRAQLPHNSLSTFAENVGKMERIALRELREFWRESERTSFIL